MKALARALVKAGQFLPRLWRRLRTWRDRPGLHVPGLCSQWGCALPVNSESPFGRGPVCMVCRQGLRPVAWMEIDDVQR